MTSIRKRVFISPLDWGLGHASRIIPIIDFLHQNNYEVFLGGSGKSALLLKETYPHLKFIDLPSPIIRYSKHSSFLLLKMIVQIPVFLYYTIKEHNKIREICSVYQINLVISDNRYGLFCKNVYTIFITHQISPVLPWCIKWAEYPIYKMIKTIAEKYNECWIPDYENESISLSGKLSHRYIKPRNSVYIGLLSRFQKTALEEDGTPGIEKYDIVVIASGPEPQLSTYIKMIIKQSLQTTCSILIISGYADKIEHYNMKMNKFVSFVPHLAQNQFKYVLNNARLIICRAGYSTIMDLSAIRKSALLIPTPGQPEQEYLAVYLSRKHFFFYMKQSDLNLASIISGYKIINSNIEVKNNHREYEVYRERIINYENYYG